MTVSITEVQYLNFGKCLKISDGTVEAIVTVDIGPRIMSCGFVGGENIMYNDMEHESETTDPSFATHYYPGASWWNYGGHRTWVSPEKMPDTYYPDIHPVEYEILENGAVFKQEPQLSNGIQINLTVTLDDGEFTVVQTVTNISGASKRLSPWGITVLNKGGLEIIPQNTRQTGLLPNRRVILWPYSDMADSRINFGTKYITLRQSTDVMSAFKLGLDNHSGVAAYVIGDTVFVNRGEHIDGAEYDDFGTSFETYTNDRILEMEMLGKVAYLEDGEKCEMVEHWKLFRNPGTPDPKNDIELDNFMKSLKL